jgi:hypothetical protein
LATYVIDERGLSERQACRTVNLNRCTFRYPVRKNEDLEIIQELRQLAERQPRCEVTAPASGLRKNDPIPETSGSRLAECSQSEPQTDPQGVP